LKPAIKKLLVVTDLDATLLDDAYSWSAAEPALARLKAKGYPLVLNSSKTVPEMKSLASEMGLQTPIIAENGGLIAVPSASGVASGDYAIRLTGLSREFILEQAHRLRVQENYEFTGFADWTAKQVAEKTGLSEAMAGHSQTRYATEPILWDDTEARLNEFQKALAQSEIRILRGGRFLHLMGPADKADGAASALKFYQEAEPDVSWTVVALGDSANDCAMLEAADIAVVIPHAGGTRIDPQAPRVVRAPYPSTKGWNASILSILDEYC
jgi:mannosyl-3-phosphoglycerate phosphatase